MRGQPWLHRRDRDCPALSVFPSHRTSGRIGIEAESHPRLSLLMTHRTRISVRSKELDFRLIFSIHEEDKSKVDGKYARLFVVTVK